MASKVVSNETNNEAEKNIEKSYDGLLPKQLLETYRTMVLSRCIDDREIVLKRQQKIYFQISCAGHEAIQLAAAANLRPGYDWFFPYYRDRALCLALGVEPAAMFLQAVGAADDPASGGRQMPSHWGCPERNIFTTSSPTGTQYVQAVGCAEGQRKLGASRVAIIGCGATGSVLSSLLVRAGVGYVRIVDRDYIEPSNLQRQVLFDENDAAESLPKAVAAARQLRKINSSVTIEEHVEDLTPDNCEDLLEEVDLILDGTDNFETRYLLNDYAVRENRPWIYTAAVGSYGVTMNVLPGETACLACVFPHPPTGPTETCETGGILNATVNLIASVAVTEAMKFLSGKPEAMRRTLLSFDAWHNDQSEIGARQPRPDCTVCHEHNYPYLNGQAHAHISMCGRNSVQIHERHRPIDFAKLETRLAAHGTVHRTEYVLKFEREPYELTVFPDGRAIIKGTTDTGVARSLYARFIGA